MNVQQKWNRVIDNKSVPIDYYEIQNIKKKKLNISRRKIIKWLNKGSLKHFTKRYIHKKGLEFFFSNLVLDIKQNDLILDAAGGKSDYLNAVRANTGASNLYLADHIYKDNILSDDGINIIGGDISSINLKNNSITKIACHHAFEHFKDNKDFEFIKESYRILKDKGVLAIVPLFITQHYIECWNIDSNQHFDKSSIVIIDKSASIPGDNTDGHFARLYSIDALLTRIIKPAESVGFQCEIIECEVDGKSIPNMSVNFGSIINKPLRVLKLTKV